MEYFCLYGMTTPRGGGTPLYSMQGDMLPWVDFFNHFGLTLGYKVALIEYDIKSNQFSLKTGCNFEHLWSEMDGMIFIALYVGL